MAGTSPDNILQSLAEAEKHLSGLVRRSLIIQPGALGDCILTLPLAGFFKTALGAETVQMIGRSDYIDIFVGRTCVDAIRSLDSIDLHRLFVEPDDLALEDGDQLIDTFAGFDSIVTFLGSADSNFERNLIYTANCSNPTEVITIDLKPSASPTSHISDFYISQYSQASQIPLLSRKAAASSRLIEPGKTDYAAGADILKTYSLQNLSRLAVIAPGSGGREKCWHLDNYCTLAQALIENDIAVLFLLGPAEFDRFGETALKQLKVIAPCTDSLPLAQAMQIMSCADCFIGNDSGTAHLAASLGKPTLAIFGPTDPAVYKPLGTAAAALSLDEYDFAQPSAEAIDRCLAVVSEMLNN